MTARQIEEAAVKLPKRDRERIADRPRETLHSKRDQQVLDAWVAEAERGDRELDEGKEVALPYEQLMAELRASFRGRQDKSRSKGKRVQSRSSSSAAMLNLSRRIER
jgi:hypothetical protein